MDSTIVDKWSGIVSAGTLVFSWLLFWKYTGEPVGSFFIAALAAGMIFLAYIVVRMLILTFRR